MRAVGVAIAILVAATAVARADTYEDEDGEFLAMPKRSVGASFTVHGSRLAGHSESGTGFGLELALGRARWQYLVEGGYASAIINATGAPDLIVRGRVARAGLGARWLARQFRPESEGALELYLMSLLGTHRYYLDDGTRLTRPEVAFGFGIQARVVQLAFRIEIRAVFTPSTGEDAVAACRGRCMDDTGASTGFQGGIGFAW